MNLSALSSMRFDDEDLVGSVSPPLATHLRHLPPLSLCALVAVFATLCTQLTMFLLKCLCRAICKFLVGRRRRRTVVDTDMEGTTEHRQTQKSEKLLCYTPKATLTPTRKSRRAVEGTKRATTTDGDRGVHSVVDLGGAAMNGGRGGQHGKRMAVGENNPFELVLPNNDHQRGEPEDVLVEIARTVPTFD